MATVEAFNTGLTEAQLTTAFHRALNDYTDAQVDALIAAAVSGIGLTVSVIAADDTYNPTYDTPTASAGIVLTFASAENSDVGFRVCANTSGEVFACAKQSTGWHEWSELIGLT